MGDSGWDFARLEVTSTFSAHSLILLSFRKKGLYSQMTAGHRLGQNKAYAWT